LKIRPVLGSGVDVRESAKHCLMLILLCTFYHQLTTWVPLQWWAFSDY